MKCKQECLKTNTPCNKTEKECRYVIYSEKYLNCCLVAADNGPLTLEEIAEVEKQSLVRIHQRVNSALEKLSKRVDIDMVYD
jgi:hypothetical protein